MSRLDQRSLRASSPRPIRHARSWRMQSLRMPRCTASSYRLTAETGDHIERRLTSVGPLDEEQRSKLADVAERTPVTLVIKAGVAINTHLSGQEMHR